MSGTRRLVGGAALALASAVSMKRVYAKEKSNQAETRVWMTGSKFAIPFECSEPGASETFGFPDPSVHINRLHPYELFIRCCCARGRLNLLDSACCPWVLCSAGSA